MRLVLIVALMEMFVIISGLNKNLFNHPALTFSPHLSTQDFRFSLRNKTIVFLGDSVTRYQYLNLAFFLERGRWPMEYLTDEVLQGSPCCQRSFIGFSWQDFFQLTTLALNNHELCDCWRKIHTSSSSFIAAVENRRYFHPELQTHLVRFQHVSKIVKNATVSFTLEISF
jgi:hypothetical protein